MTAQSAKTFEGIRPAGFTWGNAEHDTKAQVFLFLFSGFLSAFRCVTFYMEEVCDNRKPMSSWYRDEKVEAAKRKSLLAALCFLRDSDVHDGTLFPSAGVTHTWRRADQSTSSEFVLGAQPLQGIERLRKHPWAIDALASESVIAISAKALDELESLFEKGKLDGVF
jgi:hypothetical protein